MKVEGTIATTTAAVHHHKDKVKVKEEKECFQQVAAFSTSSSTFGTSSVSVATTATGSNGVSTVVTTSTTATPISTATTVATCHQSVPASSTNPRDASPVDLDLKAKAKGVTGSTSGTRENVNSQNEGLEASPSPQSLKASARNSSRSPETRSPLPSQLVKVDYDEEAASSRAEVENESSNGGSKCIPSVLAGHGKLKRLLGTLVQFASDISQDTGDTVRALVLALLSGSMTAEEFHAALQEATNFPLRGFVLPYLKHTLPSLQRDLNHAARANNQTCVQYLRTNESAVLEVVGLAVPSGESAELFGEHGNHCGPHYSRPNSSASIGGQHGSSGLLHYSPNTAHAPKRRASDNSSYYENGGLLEDGPIYAGKRSNIWGHHQHHHQQQQQPQQQQSGDTYCWYHPLHSSGGTVQGLSHGHGPSPVPPSLVQINQINSFGTQQMAQQQQQMQQMQNGSSLDDEWKNIHVMLNCILGMVDKTKRALAILQRRGCSSPATSAVATVLTTAQNGTGTSGNPSSTNGGSQVESSVADRDGSLKRLSGEIVAHTIRATEDRVAEVKRRAEEAVLEVKRAAVAEVQRAVAVAVAESRANERLRVHRLLDLPMSQRSHSSIRQSSFLRVHGTGSAAEPTARGTATPTTTATTASSTIPSTTEDDKDTHLTNLMSSSCWNCGRPALETCGGCGIARYCGSFCQHRDWEAGGHHATCNNPTPRERRRSASRSPTRVCPVSVSDTENHQTPTAVNVAKGK
ncbi:protein CBFA2T3 [Prorops nasuta]|uniref:protein CBFA2T3 n=1 Tax=Prorops nasuta TaxID=863751 RepID=UPI0034CE34A9